MTHCLGQRSLGMGLPTQESAIYEDHLLLEGMVQKQ